MQLKHLYEVILVLDICKQSLCGGDYEYQIWSNHKATKQNPRITVVCCFSLHCFNVNGSVM